MIEVGSYVRMTQELKSAMMSPCLERGFHFEFTSEDDCICCSIGHIKEFGFCVGKVHSIDFTNDVTVIWLPSNLKYHYLIEHLELCDLRAFI
jgi:hypothetical protein